MILIWARSSDVSVHFRPSGNEPKRRKPERRAKLSKKTTPSKSGKKTFSNWTKENQTNIYIFDFTKDEGTTFK
jgi:hypothetical protein